MLAYIYIYRERNTFELMKVKEEPQSPLQEQITERLELLFQPRQFMIVEIHQIWLKQQHFITIVLFHPDGFDLDICEELHKIAEVEIARILPKDEAFRLEISSPGIERKLRHKRELKVFRGRPVRCMYRDKWLQGILGRLEEDEEGRLQGIYLRRDQEEQYFDLQGIQKIELYSEELN